MFVIDSALKSNLKKSDLRYVNDEMPGISRRKADKNFKYFDSDNKSIISEVILFRIKSLSIPPAWKDVWICSSPSGYLQATGFDEKKRKQYIYHPDWIKLSKENKFSKLAFFGKVLPEIRKKISYDMVSDILNKEKIIATVIWLLQNTLIRIGNEEYVKENDSFGLTTLRNRHVSIKGKNVRFEFMGKSGIKHTVKISHPRIAKIIKECIELPGYEIFKYIDDSGEKHIVESYDVNKYLKSLTGEDITAKDFRTWGGTVLAASTLYKFGPGEDEASATKFIRLAISKVAKHLRNTIAVCKNYYIHPLIFTSYQKQLLVPHFQHIYSSGKREERLTRDEYAVITLLNKHN